MKILLLLALALIGQTEKHKISEVYVLLPQTKHVGNPRTVNFQLEAYDGCYRWSSANENIVALEEIGRGYKTMDDTPMHTREQLSTQAKDQECYHTVEIDPVATVDDPSVTLIAAKDQLNSRSILKCEVKVGRIHRLEILTTVRSIRVRDQERIYVQAFDEIGNVFTSLEGLRFRWTIEEGEKSLILSKLSDSKLTASEVRKGIENDGYGWHSDEILIVGRMTGLAKVSVKIEEKGYEHVLKATAPISVSEPFAIVPSSLVYVPPRAKIQYRLFKISENYDYRQIELASPEYIWRAQAEEDDILKVKDSGAVYSLDSIEKDMVVVSDKQIEENNVSCEVHVVAPDRIKITVEPYTGLPDVQTSYTFDEFREMEKPKQALEESNWYLISGKSYLFRIHLYWEDKEVHIPKNADFGLMFDHLSPFLITKHADNYEWMVVMPKFPDGYDLDVMSSKLNGKLERVKALPDEVERHETYGDWVPKSPIVDIADVYIIRPLEIIEEVRPILLPYFAMLTDKPNSDGRIAQEYRIQTRGGSGRNLWKSETDNIASVTNRGITFAHRLGKTTITVYDSNNQHNFDSVDVEVAEVKRLQWITAQKDIVTEQEDTMALRAHPIDQRVYHNCTSIFTNWQNNFDHLELLGKHRIDKESRLSGVCEIRSYKGTSDGFASMTAVLEHTPTEVAATNPSINVHSADSKIGFFKPVSLQWDQEQHEVLTKSSTKSAIQTGQELILSEKTSWTFDILGGPLTWPEHSDAHVLDVKISNRYIEHSIGKPVSKGDPSTLTIVCSSYDVSESVEISILNKPSGALQEPGQSTYNLAMSCQNPYSVKMNWKDTHPDELSFKSQPVRFDRYKHNPGYTGTDGQTWIMLNDQELQCNTTFYDYYKREIVNTTSIEKTFTTEKNTFIDYHHKNEIHNERATTLSKEAGNVQLKVESSKYRISDTLENIIVHNVALTPDSYSMYYFRDNSHDIDILHGSGHFQVSIADGEIIRFEYDGARRIRVKPLREGRTRIRVDDLSLAGSVPAYSTVIVSGIASIALSEDTLIPVGTTTKLNASVYDVDHNEFTTKEITQMELRLNSDDSINLKSVDNEVFFTVLGSQIGEYPVTITGKMNRFDTSGIEIKSNFVNVDVFPPLEIIPPEVLLMPGQLYSLDYAGGPLRSKYSYYNIEIKWSMQKTSIATIDSTALVNAQDQGTSPVLLEMFKKKEFLTSAAGKVVVDYATDIAILGMPSGRTILKESATRLVAQFYIRNEPLLDAVSDTTFNWRSNSPQKYELYKESGLEGQQIAVTGIARDRGTSDIQLTAQIRYPNKNAPTELKASAIVTVEPGLYAETPSHRCHSHSESCNEDMFKHDDSKVLLLPRNAEYIIPFSKDTQVSIRCEGCQKNFLQVVQEKKLLTNDGFGEATLIVDNINPKGDLHFVDTIVDDVDYIHVDRSYSVMNIPLGSSYNLDVIYQDTFARSYPRGFIRGMNAGVKLSNSKVLQAELVSNNDTLSLTSQYVGSTMVTVYMIDEPMIKDVFQVTVSSIMKPVSPVMLLVGDTMEFEHTQGQATDGTWRAEQPTVLQVDKHGRVETLKEGDSIVRFEQDNTVLNAKVKVRMVRSIEAEDTPVISNYDRDEDFKPEYVIPLKLFTDIAGNEQLTEVDAEEKHLIKRNLKLTCSTPSHSSFIDVESQAEFESRTRQNPNDGYSCIIRPKLNFRSPDIVPNEMEIKVTASTTGKAKYEYSEIIKLPYKSRYYIYGDLEATVSGAVRSASWKIGGTCDELDLQYDANALDVATTYKKETGECILTADVRDRTGEFSYKRIDVSNKRTGQTDQLIISFSPEARSAGDRAVFHDWLLIIVVAVVALLLVYFLSSKTQQPQIPRPQSYQQPNRQYMPQQPYAGNQHPPQQAPASHRSPGRHPHAASSPGSTLFKNVAYR